MLVEVDLLLSARQWFETKEKQASKQEKKIVAHTQNFKATEKKTQQKLPHV